MSSKPLATVSSCYCSSCLLSHTIQTGVISPSTVVAALVNDSSNPPDLQRHFSSFPMTSHLHAPALRLVSLHPLLQLSFTFARVPEIHDSFEWKVFISKTMTVNDVVSLATEELGLVKSLPIPGSGSIEYVLEEVWVDGNSESKILCNQS